MTEVQIIIKDDLGVGFDVNEDEQKVNVAISKEKGNILTSKDDGLFASCCLPKVEKVTLSREVNGIDELPEHSDSVTDPKNLRDLLKSDTITLTKPAYVARWVDRNLGSGGVSFDGSVDINGGRFLPIGTHEITPLEGSFDTVYGFIRYIDEFDESAVELPQEPKAYIKQVNENTVRSYISSWEELYDGMEFDNVDVSSTFDVGFAFSRDEYKSDYSSSDHAAETAVLTGSTTAGPFTVSVSKGYSMYKIDVSGTGVLGEGDLHEPYTLPIEIQVDGKTYNITVKGHVNWTDPY
ncbi:hypothetical protein HPC38_02310 [Pasteurellaceae bacterium HPA106]|uniref:hypothetical protein n=1 Tax=Spirabiliibacterium pneumoniae TaxID=221400 RepID=UPI001AAE0675|nr:hypothetical protein [Spirabiliibacterium pneumoniae]MBE2895712.1 hypothetical protein [Spirabiliibacterium pneumoniae]